MKQKGSSDVKGSLWNHLDKKVILWHSEAPLFFKSACCENLADVLLVQLCKIMKCHPTDYKNEITIFGCRTLVWRKSLLPRLWN